MAGVTFVRGASLEEEAKATFRSLVGSMELPPDVLERIREIITRSTAAQAALPSQITVREPAPGPGGGTMIPGMWTRVMLLNAERDAAIRTLLAHPEQVRTFDANAAALQAQLNAIRPNGVT